MVSVEFFERLWLQVKGMRTMFLVPLIGYYCVIPLSVWAMSHGPEFSLVGSIIDICYLLVPFLSTWWIYLIVKEYIEGDGREVLLLGKGTLSSALLFWFLNILCFIPLNLIPVEAWHVRQIVDLFVQLIIISFFMGGLAYFLNYFTKSITISMLVIILYTFISNYRFSHQLFANIFHPVQLTILQDVPYEDNLNGYIKFILAGVIFWVMGVVKSKRMQ